MTKAVKIGLGVGFLLLVIGLLYWLFFSGSSSGGNKYASAESIKKAKSGNYGKWNGGTLVGGDALWYQFLNKANSDFGGGQDVQPYVSAWFKGMDVSRSIANLTEFKSDIQKYVNSSFRVTDWDTSLTTGSFLDSTAQS